MQATNPTPEGVTAVSSCVCVCGGGGDATNMTNEMACSCKILKWINMLK